MFTCGTLLFGGIHMVPPDVAPRSEVFTCSSLLLRVWHTKDVFIPSWMPCLDEYISIWSNKFTCPGWMFVPRNPHPKVNEYHTICCVESRIMYRWELVEGKDRPKDLGREKFETGPGTYIMVIMWRITKPLWGTGKPVIEDSGFSVLKGFIGMYERGVYGSAEKKKRRYLPEGMYGDQINAHYIKK